MRKGLKLILLFMVMTSYSLLAAPFGLSEKTARASKIGENESLVIDGVLAEEVWKKAVPAGEFLQKNPNEGMPSSNQIDVKFMYDAKALYIGVRVWRDDPNDIICTMTRKDQSSNSERIIITLDTYRDYLTAYSLGITASGVKFDYNHANDQEYNRDYSWEPVWEGQAVIDSKGWTAEMRIPFSQLRFNKQKNQIWGLNMNCWMPHEDEDAYWVLVPKSESGWSSRMGKLVGINDIEFSQQLEIMPYIGGSTVINPNYDKNDPFANEFQNDFRYGADIKLGLGSNLTLDATINPDFGQVEADPAEVNLSAFETYFAEKRPFFTEGKKLLLGNGPDYFYSRRIGATPRGYLPDDAEYYDYPQNTKILGAAKITGRTKDGLSVGALSSITERTYSKYSIENNKREVEVEPLAFFNVARLQKEIDDQGSALGFMLTSVNRDVEDNTSLSEALNTSAYSGGLDWRFSLDSSTYLLTGYAGFSHLRGSQESIYNRQLRSTHYFQRPDQDNYRLDSNATTLSGYTFRTDFNKVAGEHWRWGARVFAVSPGFDLNDMGKLHKANKLNAAADISYRDNEVGEIFHSYNINLQYNTDANYDFDVLNRNINLWTNWTFLNFHRFGFNTTISLPSMSDDLTRGGPLMETPGNLWVHTSYHSNDSKNHSFNISLGMSENTIGGDYKNISLTYDAKIAGRLEMSLSTSYTYQNNARHYITTLEGGRKETFDHRYIFSNLERNTISTSLRLNLAFTNDLTLEMYFQPYTTSANFSDFGELAEPGTNDLISYDEGEYSISLDPNNSDTYFVNSPDGDFSFDRTNFNNLSFRSNFVLRWEWLPGSTMFLVWQQNREDYLYGSSDLVDLGSWSDTFSAEGTNTVAFKVSYWLPVN